MPTVCPRFLLLASAATLAFKIKADVYQSNGTTLIGTFTLASLSANLPSVWTPQTAILNLAGATYANARYIKLRFIGGHTSSATAGSVYVDGISLKTQDFQKWTEFSGLPSAIQHMFVVPPDTYFLRVTCIGCGAGGGSLGTGMSFAGGGGGSGSFAQSVLPVTPGTAYNVVFGVPGGPVAGADGQDGGNATFSLVSTIQVQGMGGKGGKSGTTGVGGAGGTGGTGQITYDGIAGQSAGSSTGGQGAPSVQGGAGGYGGQLSSPVGKDATSIPLRGAGGGGAYRNNNTNGGNGAMGTCIVEW